MSEYRYIGTLAIEFSTIMDVDPIINDLDIALARRGLSGICYFAPDRSIHKDHGKTRIEFSYRGEKVFGWTFSSWLETLVSYCHAYGLRIEGDLQYIGDEEGFIQIRHGIIYNYTAMELASKFLSLQSALETQYRRSIRVYFADTTEEGKIAKYARMEENEKTMTNLFQIPEKEINAIYEEERLIRANK